MVCTGVADIYWGPCTKFGRRSGWWWWEGVVGSDNTRNRAGNVGGGWGGLDRGYQGGLVILKATREASCTGESFADQRMRATLVSPLLPL